MTTGRINQVKVSCEVLPGRQQFHNNIPWAIPREKVLTYPLKEQLQPVHNIVRDQKKETVNELSMRTGDMITLNMCRTLSQRQPVAPPWQTITHKPRNIIFWLSWEIALRTANFGSNTSMICHRMCRRTKIDKHPPPCTMFLHLPLFYFWFFFCNHCGFAFARLMTYAFSMAAQMRFDDSMRSCGGADKWNKSKKPCFPTPLRVHASTLFSSSPMRPNRHMETVVLPTPPPSCSLNPLPVNSEMPRNKT